MTRVAIYARFSTDKQNERSAEDQAALCRAHAAKQGWAVVEAFADLAMSGATRNRPGLNALLERAGEFDVVLAESIDRISRDQEDIAAIFKRLRFAGARLITLSEGDVSELHIGLGGTIAAVQLRQIAEKTRRGQLGRVAQGRIPGGLSYGYALVPGFDARGQPDRGRRTIVEAEAAVVRRIFAEFLNGRSARQIAQGLNAEGVPAPNGRKWGASTINGNVRRGTGILHNALYDGRIVYNRQRFDKHPESRRRVARLNPREEWTEVAAPELRIVDAADFAGVQARFAELQSVPLAQQRRPKRLLSGLVTCGVCGGSYIVINVRQWGCGNHRAGKGCANNRVISTAELDRRVLGALAERMLAPAIVEAWLAELRAELERDRRARLRDRGRLERNHARAAAKVERLLDAIADGLGALADLKPRLLEAIAERDSFAAQLAEDQAEAEIAVHPGIVEVFRRQLADLEGSMVDDATGEARAAIRAMIENVRAMPRTEGPGLDLTLTGRLAAILQTATTGHAEGKAGGLTTVVAGAGFEPAAFRL